MGDEKGSMHAQPPSPFLLPALNQFCSNSLGKIQHPILGLSSLMIKSTLIHEPNLSSSPAQTHHINHTAIRNFEKEKERVRARANIRKAFCLKAHVCKLFA